MKEKSKQIQDQIKEIVDFYMDYVTEHKSEIRESLEYSWNCMTDWTIKDYLETVNEHKKKIQEIKNMEKTL